MQRAVTAGAADHDEGGDGGQGEDRKDKLVGAAARILAAEGPAALTVRRVAREAGTSTMAVYSQFGTKGGLLAALHRIGFERLGAALRAASTSPGTSLEALTAVGVAYRQAALSQADLYDLMFGRRPADLDVDVEGTAISDAAFDPLLASVERCFDEGTLAGADPAVVATHLWIVAHGAVSLELAGRSGGPDPASAYGDALAHSVAAWLVPRPQHRVSAPPSPGSGRPPR